MNKSIDLINGTQNQSPPHFKVAAPGDRTLYALS